MDDSFSRSGSTEHWLFCNEQQRWQKQCRYKRLKVFCSSDADHSGERNRRETLLHRSEHRHLCNPIGNKWPDEKCQEEWECKLKWEVVCAHVISHGDAVWQLAPMSCWTSSSCCNNDEQCCTIENERVLARALRDHGFLVTVTAGLTSKYVPSWEAIFPPKIPEFVFSMNSEPE